MGTSLLGSFQSRHRALDSWTTNVSSFWFHFSRLKTLLRTLDVALVGKERRVRTLLNITLPRIKNTKTQVNYASYDIEPLEAGYGMSLGNDLRRVLLSSLPGAAVTSIRIEGAQHEFQDIPHVVEDVTDIVLNIKKLRLRSFSDHAVSMHLEVSGERDITAADIQAPSTVEIVNPDLHIATLDSDSARLDMEMVVEIGKGYVPADSQEDQPLAGITVDAIYSPLHKVNYNVEHTRVGQITNFDKIILDIWTDGTITPDHALRQTSDIPLRHFTH